VAMGQYFGVFLATNTAYCMLLFSDRQRAKNEKLTKNASSGIEKHWMVFGLKHIGRSSSTIHNNAF
jgi:hypothetical protein